MAAPRFPSLVAPHLSRSVLALVPRDCTARAKRSLAGNVGRQCAISVSACSPQAASLSIPRGTGLSRFLQASYVGSQEACQASVVGNANGYRKAPA